MIDPNDPWVANKVVWNNVFRPITSDDYDLRFYDCDSAFTKNGPQTQQIEYFQIGHYAGYDLVGRTEVEPLPTDPDFKTTGRYGFSGSIRFSRRRKSAAPASSAGATLILIVAMTSGASAPDPSCSSYQRIHHELVDCFGHLGTCNPDHYSGFNPKTEQYLYKFLGEKNMLGCAHAEHSPEQRCATDGGTSACPEAWEMRHMYVIEALPAAAVSTRSTHARSSIWTAKCGSSPISILMIVGQALPQPHLLAGDA